MQEFFGAGGENPESYFKAFSNEILEAAFNVKKLQPKFHNEKQKIFVYEIYICFTGGW